MHTGAKFMVRGASLPLVLSIGLAVAACGGGGSNVTQHPPPPSVQYTVGAIPMTPLMTPGTSFSTLFIAIPLVGSSWNGVIDVTMAGLPAGLTANPASFSVNTATQNGQVTVVFTASSSLATGVHPFTVTGTSGSMTYSIAMAIGVVAPPPQPDSLQAKVIYSFTGQQDGGDPSGELISDGAGNLYGATAEGGTYGAGTVFELSFAGGLWNETVLHSFGNGTDGSEPIGGLAFDAAGNLYGVTRNGGTNTYGTVFKLTPSGSEWQETVLHSFSSGTDGMNPGTGVVVDNAGNVYGTTEYGGSSSAAECSNAGCGTVFTVTALGGGSAYSVIHRFQGSPDGNDPGGGPGEGLIVDQQGNLYGTTSVGGDVNCPPLSPYSGGGGCGIIFKMAQSGGTWQESVVYTFQATYSGIHPSGLVLDSTGKLFATTFGGFSDPQCDSCGNFLELSPAGGDWALAELNYFWGGNLGYTPSGLVSDQKGNFYGIASGGPETCDTGLGCGTVFELSQSGQDWVETANYIFPGGNSGWWPSSITWSGGNLFGVTSQGGPSNYGVVFEITP